MEFDSKYERNEFLTCSKFKFLNLTKGILDKKESDRFIKIVQKLKKLKPGQLGKLNLVVKKSKLKRNFKKAIF